MTEVRFMQKVKVRGQRSRSQRSKPNLVVSGLLLQFEVTYGDEMMHKAWFGIGDVPYCFSRSSIKFQDHTAKKNADLDPNWAFPDCNSSLNSPMATKWCTELFKKKWSTELGVAWKGCPIVFQSHLSNFKVYCFSRNHRFWPELGVSGLLLQFDFTDGYEMTHKAWSSIEEVPYCFSRSSVKFQGHTGQTIIDFNLNWAFPDCNSSWISLMAMKWCTKLEVA